MTSWEHPFNMSPHPVAPLFLCENDLGNTPFRADPNSFSRVPPLARSYPCRFTFYVARPTRSILPSSFCGLLRRRVRDPQQHIGVTRLVECAPAGEIFVVQAVADVALAEIISQMLLV
jgi:hypothetical protein